MVAEQARPTLGWLQRRPPQAAAEPQPQGQWSEPSPFPLWGGPQLALSRAQARYPFLEVGPPLVILPDNDLNAALPVLPLCGDGLRGRGAGQSSREPRGPAEPPRMKPRLMPSWQAALGDPARTCTGRALSWAASGPGLKTCSRAVTCHNPGAGQDGVRQKAWAAPSRAHRPSASGPTEAKGQHPGSRFQELLLLFQRTTTNHHRGVGWRVTHFQEYLLQLNHGACVLPRHP